MKYDEREKPFRREDGKNMFPCQLKRPVWTKQTFRQAPNLVQHFLLCATLQEAVQIKGTAGTSADSVITAKHYRYQ